MLSVMKHAKHPVKFWLLKNYLSPYFKVCLCFSFHNWPHKNMLSFQHFLPYMAAHYGFSYELIEYKWPRWLHRQTEKQRVMWGYKILFLDVLFPLDVKKIIFVDADQIVRTGKRDMYLKTYLQFLAHMFRSDGADAVPTRRRPLRLYTVLRQSQGDGRLPILEAGLLG